MQTQVVGVIRLRYCTLLRYFHFITEKHYRPEEHIVGIASHYGPYGPGNESRWGGGGGKEFLHPSRLALGPPQPPI
jgi:hypothetical protein